MRTIKNIQEARQFRTQRKQWTICNVKESATLNNIDETADKYKTKRKLRTIQNMEENLMDKIEQV